jgi:hypothetical protein
VQAGAGDHGGGGWGFLAFKECKTSSIFPLWKVGGAHFMGWNSAECAAPQVCCIDNSNAQASPNMPTYLCRHKYVA